MANTFVADRIAEIDAELSAVQAEQARRIEQQLDSYDSALSTWADGITRNQLLLERELLENGGTAPFLALVTLDGQPVNARMIDSKHGSCWAICDDRGKYTGVFLPICDSADDCECGTPYRAKDAKIRKKGYRQVAVMRPAVARVVGSGRGMAGTARAAVVDPITGQGSCAWLASEVSQ